MENIEQRLSPPPLSSPSKGGGFLKNAVVLLFCFISLSLHADSYFGVRVFGDPVEAAAAKSAAMGGTVAADYNPEFARRILSLTGASVWTSQMWTESARQTRLADENRFEFGNLSLAMSSKNRRWRWELSAAPMMNFNAQSSYRIYNSTGLPTGENRFTDAGNILKLGSALSIPLGSRLSVKAGIYNLTGRETLRLGKYPLNAPPAMDLRESARYDGISEEAGLQWQPSKKINIGALYRPAVTLKRKSHLMDLSSDETMSVHGQWRLPPQAILGFNFHPGDERPIELAVDVKHTFWRQAAINGLVPSGVAAMKPILREILPSTGTLPAGVSSLRLRNVTEIGVGVNQPLGDKWSVQYGFHYQPFYADRRAETTSFTVGAGYRANDRWKWSAAGEFAMRDFIGDGVFYPSGWRIEETRKKIWLTVERSW